MYGTFKMLCATPNSYLSPTDGLTDDSPLTHTSTNDQLTAPPVSRREAGRQDWAQLRPPSFLGERPPPKNTYGGGPFQSPPPPKNTYGGGAPFPIPHRGHLPIPYLGEAVEPLPIPHIGEAVEPLPIPNLREAVEP